MSKISSQNQASVNIVVRGDVAVLTFGLGSTEDNACAAEVYALAYGSAQPPGDRSAPDHWGPGDAYLLHEQLFVHSADIAGMVHRLKQRGHWVELETFSDCTQLRDSEMPPQAFGYPNTEYVILERVRQQPCGQIVVPPDLIPGIAAGVTKMFSTSNVLVVAKNSDSVRGLVRRLKKLTNRNVTHGPSVAWHAQPLIHVQALSGVDRAGHDWHVLIFGDAESARSDTGMRLANSMPHAAIYSLLSWQQKLDWEDLLRIRITSGPELHRLIDGPVDRGIVTVVRVPAKRLHKRVPRSPLMRKRCRIWQNIRRNQQVAGLAKAFANRDQQQLALCGIPIAKLQQQLAGIGERPRVAIIVENAEHARALRKHLLGWRIATGARVADKAIPQLPMDEARVIITLTRARTAGVVADVIIRADGSEQGWRWEYGPHFGLNQSSMIIVDMVDGFDACAFKIGRSRHADYARHAWQVIEAETGNPESLILSNT